MAQAVGPAFLPVAAAWRAAAARDCCWSHLRRRRWQAAGKGCVSRSIRRGMSGAHAATVDDSAVAAKAAAALAELDNLPRLVVFDLDYTLWPYYCECLSKRDTPYLYSDAKGIIFALKEKGIDMAVASRSPAPAIARAFLDKLNLQSTFVAQEIFPSWTHKTEHFQRIQQKTGLPYESMLFFDDEDRNTDTVSKMGVTCVLVDNGLNLEMFKFGLRKFASNSSNLTTKD